MNAKTIRKSLVSGLIISLLSILTGCETVNDDRIPNLAVSINLADPGLWNMYGVSGYGSYRYFIRQLSEPSGFHYTTQTFTGYGGILLIEGIDPFANSSSAPMAYDLSCPVECKPEVRVAMDLTTLQAVCPNCGSTYDVTMAGGGPTGGPALTGPRKYGLRRYQVYRASSGGWAITN